MDSTQLATTYVPGAQEDQATGSFEQSTARELSAHEVFGDYQIVRRLGRGGMGAVYEADHLTTGRRVALKVLSHSLDSREARSRFLREGRLAAAINHRNSVYLFGTEEIEGIPTISMELISGGTLASQVQKFGPMPVEQAVDTILQVIAGLQAAEEKGVLHRDVKPANCFVDQDGQVKIGDFGLSISNAPADLNAVSNITQEGAFLGTPAFASPEQLRGEQLDQRSDIYAVGVTLFYLLIGKPPFEGRNMIQLLATVLDKAPPAVNKLREDVPPELANVVDACLAKSSGSRPANYDRLQELLGPFCSRKPVPATLGQRFLAGVVDYLVVMILTVLVNLSLRFFIGPDAHRYIWSCVSVAVMFVGLIYFTFCESRFGRSLGKQMLGLRVTAGGTNPSWKTAAVRAFVYDVVPRTTTLVAGLVIYLRLDSELTLETATEHAFFLQTMGLLGYSGVILRGCLFIPAFRKPDGVAYHDRWTETCVIVEPSTEVRSSSSAETADEFDQVDSGERIGPYAILATLSEDNTGTTVLGYDTRLLRRVWIRKHAHGVAATDRAGRYAARSGRLRWLGGNLEGENWDCYEAPDGHSLAEHSRPDWGVDRHLVVSLVNELQQSIEESTLPKSISLQHLWLSGQNVKLLPFTAPDTPDSYPMTPITTGTTEVEQQQACTHIVSQFAKHLSYISGDEAVVSIPISAREHMDSLANCESMAQCSESAKHLLAGEARVGRMKRLSLLLVTFAIPILLPAGWLIGQLGLFFPISKFPEVRNLRNDAQLLWHQESIHRRSFETPENAKNLAAMRVYVAGVYRHLYEDPAVWNSRSVQIAFPIADMRQDVEAAMNMPPPTKDEIARATKIRETLAANQAKNQADMRYFSLQGVLPSTAYWLIVVWFPGLLAAIICRGGLLVRSFGVGFVDKQSRPASRLRLLWRAAVSGLPALLAVAYAFYDRPDQPWFNVMFSPTANVGFMIIGAGLLIWTARRRRFLSDLLSGCHLVPR